MGDTGSMALGSVLAVIALMTGQWPMLLVIGIIPLAKCSVW
jgi:phospho-N-acetylmuramoyl-pentapeptide-transferase